MTSQMNNDTKIKCVLVSVICVLCVGFLVWLNCRFDGWPWQVFVYYKASYEIKWGAIVGDLIVIILAIVMSIVWVLLTWYERGIERGDLCPTCDYDLRGTRAAGRHICPECGESFGCEQDNDRRIGD